VIGLTGLALIAAAGLIDRDPGASTGVVQIGTAVQALSGRNGGAARTTEQVTYADQNLELTASALVVDGALLDAAGAPPSVRHDWALVQTVLPDAALREVRQINIVTDGVNGTLAMVHRSTRDGNGWILSIDSAESDRVLESTLVHEFGHMLTLRREDLAGPGTTDPCPGVAIAIGCARAGSALADWATAFWPGVAEPAHDDPRAFVSTYAATSVHEDLAESFLAYVLGTEARPSPAIDRKLAFFAARPEFVAARAAVRTKMGLDPS
jgi:hypothetical protein